MKIRKKRPMPALSEEQLGGIAAQLALEFPAWIERRVEHVSYLDGVTIRHTEGVMVRWPAPEFFPPGARPAVGSLIYVPLDLLTKSPLAGLDGIRPDGSPFPILPASRSAAVASAGIAAIVWGRSQTTRGRGLEAQSLRLLDAIVHSPPAIAGSLLSVLDDRSSELGEILVEHSQVRGLVEELAANVMFLVPAVYRPGEEAVYRYTYCQSLTRKDPLPNRMLAALGFTDVAVVHKRLSLGWSGSYHFQVEAPGEVRIARARLRGTYGSDPARRETALVAEAGDGPLLDLPARRPTIACLREGHAADPPTRPPALPRLDPGSGVAGALAAARAAAPTETERSDAGEAEIRLRLNPFGTFLATMVVSCLTALLLVAALTRLPELDGQTSATLLLALPVLTLGYLTRPGEHSLATRLLAGIRAMALTVGICALLIAGILSMGFVHHKGGAGRAAGHTATVPGPTQVVADAATGLASLLALLLLAGWISTWRRRSGMLPEQRVAP